MKPITVFDTNITIRAFSASNQEHIGRTVTIKEFAEGDPVGLFELPDGELLCKTRGYGRFIVGVEVA